MKNLFLVACLLFSVNLLATTLPDWSQVSEKNQTNANRVIKNLEGAYKSFEFRGEFETYVDAGIGGFLIDTFRNVDEKSFVFLEKILYYMAINKANGYDATKLIALFKGLLESSTSESIQENLEKAAELSKYQEVKDLVGTILKS